MKKVLKKIFNKLGVEVISASHYKELTKPKQEKKTISEFAKNSLLHNFYGILKKEGFNPACIYDIGANKGTWTKECMSFFPESKFILFEPQVGLTENIRTVLGNSNYEIHSVGVGSENGELSFTMHERDDSCSFRFTAEEAAERGFKQVKVPIVRLDDFIESNQLPLPDLLKIDAEGLDLEVLEGAKKSIIEKTEVILVEVGVVNKDIKNSSLQVLKTMDELGFCLFDITDLNRPFSNKVLWLCEFAFIKKGGMLDKDYRIISK
jgi:FkbM family methyltransferase